MASPYLYNISDVNLLLVVSRLRREQHECYMPKNRYEQYRPAEISTMILTHIFDFINDSDWIRKVFKRIIEISAKLIGLNPDCESLRQQTSFTWTSMHRSLHTNLDFDQNCRYFFFIYSLKYYWYVGIIS